MWEAIGALSTFQAFGYRLQISLDGFNSISAQLAWVARFRQSVGVKPAEVLLKVEDLCTRVEL